MVWHLDKHKENLKLHDVIHEFVSNMYKNSLKQGPDTEKF